VARVFTQQDGIDYYATYSDVVAGDSLRLLLALAAKEGMYPRQLDIKTAYLYG
jgi:hypothetical protein